MSDQAIDDQINRLHEAIAAVCPIAGVSIGTPGDNSTVTIFYDPPVSAAQQAAAHAALASFDWSDAGQKAWRLARNRTQAGSEQARLTTENSIAADIAALSSAIRQIIVALQTIKTKVDANVSLPDPSTLPSPAKPGQGDGR